MKKVENDVDVLLEFLRMPLNSSQEIFDKFLTIKGAQLVGGKSKECLYIPGTREDRALLVAHVDTVWDSFREHDVVFDKKSNKVFSPAGYVMHCVKNAKQIDYSKFNYKDPKCLSYGLGADDRAGVAILWLLRNSGHSILLTTGEEIGAVGARLLVKDKKMADEINSHSVVIEFDKMGYREFKNYQVGSPELRGFIYDKLNYKFIDSFAYTDICFLCQKACGVNFGIGYYNEHTHNEFVDVTEWQNTLNQMRDFLKNNFPHFTFEPKLKFNRGVKDRDFVLTHYGIEKIDDLDDLDELDDEVLDVEFDEKYFRRFYGKENGNKDDDDSNNEEK